MRISALALSALWLLPAAGPLRAQQVDLAAAYDQGVAALDSGNFEAGLRIVDQVLETQKDAGLRRYGPVFGHFPYLKGMLLIRQGKYAEAMPFLQSATEDYPNDQVKQGQAPNVFLNHARVQWGMCLQALGDSAGAARKFEEALAADSASKGPKINRIAVEMNLGRCYLKTGREAEGEALLRKVLDLKNLPPDALQDAFTALASEGADFDVMDMVRQNTGALLGSEADRNVMNPRFAGLAAKALNEGDAGKALLWYHLMGSPRAALAESSARRSSLEARKSQAKAEGNEALVARIDEVTATLDKELQELVSLQDNALLGMAAANYQVGNLAAARAIYGQLLDRHPEAGDRAQILHNLVICSANLSLWEDAATLGQRFSDQFPDHPLGPGLARLLAEISAVKGDPARALSLAEAARKSTAAGSPERESLDYVAAASRYQQGNFEAAAREFAAFLQQYPTGDRRASAAFQLGSSLVKLSRWDEAIPVLGSYVDDFPRDEGRPAGLFLLSLAHLVTGNPNGALVRANHLLAQHPEAPQVAGAHHVKGDAQAALGESYEQVVRSYLESRAAALKQGADGFETAAYALKQLLAIAVEAQRWEDAMQHYEAFRATYDKSVWKTEAVTAIVPAFVALERKEEVRRLLEDEVLASGARLEVSFPAYTAFLQSHYPAPEQLEALEKFPAPDATTALRGALLLARLEILEKAEEPEAARLDALYRELDGLRSTAGEDLDNRALLRLARWHGETLRDEATALKLYDLLLTRDEGGDSRGLALVDTARLDFLSGSPERVEQARARFQQALDQFDASEVRELATLGLARIETAAERWDSAQVLWEACLDQRGWSRARAEVNYHYALCLDKRGRPDEALKVYVAVYSNYPGQLDWSTAAYLRASEILWNRGKQVDALRILQDMLRRLDGRDHPGIARAEAQFFQWRDAYANSANQ